MSLRTLYLHTAPNIGGASGPAGRKFCDELRTRSEDSLVACRVIPSTMLGGMHERMAYESLSEKFVKEFAPNLIYVEGGLFADQEGAWKIEWPVVEDMVDGGAVLIVADCGAGELSRHRHRYEYAARFLRARPQFAAGGLVCCMDKAHHWEQEDQILCRSDQMVISEWLRPVYEGVEEVLIGQPARLAAWQEALLSGNSGTTEAYEPNGERPSRSSGPCILGSSARCGQGHVVLIAGEVSADRWATQQPANIRWLLNLAELHVSDAQATRARGCTQPKPPFSLLISHRSVNRQLVLRAARWLEGSGVHAFHDETGLVPKESMAHQTSLRLENITHFVVFWSRACLGAPWVDRELGPAVGLVVERRIPLMAVRLDFTPLPEVIRDAFRVEAMGMSPQEIARSLVEAAQRMARHASQ